jgi:hypothetical protein
MLGRRKMLTILSFDSERAGSSRDDGNDVSEVDVDRSTGFDLLGDVDRVGNVVRRSEGLGRSSDRVGRVGRDEGSHGRGDDASRGEKTWSDGLEACGRRERV